MSAKGRAHISWHIAAASGGLLLGSFLTMFPAIRNFSELSWLLVAVSLFSVALLKRSKPLIVIALLGGMVFGLWRGSGEQLQLAKYVPYFGKPVVVQGRVSEDVTISSTGKQQIRLSDVQLRGRPFHGQIWVNTSSQKDLKRGDNLVVTGKLTQGFGTFAASLHRAQIEDAWRPQPGNVGRRVRDWFAEKVRVALPEPQASLGVSYALGQSQGLSETVSEQFRLLGLTHLLVASGSQLTLLVRFARRPLSRSSKYVATAAALIMIGSFLLLTGLSPSMVRAAMVSVLSLVAWYYGRTIHPAVLLLFVAGLSVALQPSFIWGDVGWLLSFAAFGGVIVLAPLINHYFWGAEKEPNFLRFLLVSTIAAQMTTLPIAIYTFGEYSPLSVLANMLVLPLVSMAMLLTLLSGVAGALVPGLAGVIGWPAQTVLTYMTSATEKLAAIPWAHGEIKLSFSVILASYSAIFALVIFLWRKTHHDFRRRVDII